MVDSLKHTHKEQLCSSGEGREFGSPQHITQPEIFHPTDVGLLAYSLLAVGDFVLPKGVTIYSSILGLSRTLRAKRAWRDHPVQLPALGTEKGQC